MKIKLNDEQKKLLASIDYAFDDNADFDGKLMELEDYITDYVLDNELQDSERGEKLLELHDYIVENYDS